MMLTDIVYIMDYDQSRKAIEANTLHDPEWTYVRNVYDESKHLGPQSITGAAWESDEYYVVEVIDESGTYLGTL